jgi:hypothetical protein
VRQLAIAIVIEFLQRLSRIGNLFGGELMVAIGIQCFHQRQRRRTVVAAGTKRRPTRPAFLLRWLGQRHGDDSQTQRRKGQQFLFHWLNSLISLLFHVAVPTWAKVATSKIRQRIPG